MPKKHPHADAVDRIGTHILRDHFDLTRQAVSHWRRNGVPRTYRKACMLLGETMGVEVPELDDMQPDGSATGSRVYALRDREGRTIYVGITTKTLENRLNGHRVSRNTDASALTRFMKDHHREVTIHLLEEVPSVGTKAFAAEARWIRKLISQGEPLLNQAKRTLCDSTKRYYESRGIRD